MGGGLKSPFAAVPTACLQSGVLMCQTGGMACFHIFHPPACQKINFPAAKMLFGRRERMGVTSISAESVAGSMDEDAAPARKNDFQNQSQGTLWGRPCMECQRPAERILKTGNPQSRRQQHSVLPRWTFACTALSLSLLCRTQPETETCYACLWRVAQRVTDL